jgi:hypothetical protein
MPVSPVSTIKSDMSCVPSLKTLTTTVDHGIIDLTDLHYSCIPQSDFGLLRSVVEQSCIRIQWAVVDNFNIRSSQ